MSLVQVYTGFNISPKKENFRWFCADHHPKKLWGRTHYLVKALDDLLEVRDPKYILRYHTVAKILRKFFTFNVSYKIALYSINNICHTCNHSFLENEHNCKAYYFHSDEWYSPLEFTVIS